MEQKILILFIGFLFWTKNITGAFWGTPVMLQKGTSHIFGLRKQLPGLADRGNSYLLFLERV